MNRRFQVLVGAVLLLTGSTLLLTGSDDSVSFPFIAFDHKAIDYMDHPVGDPIHQLQAKLESGETKLEYHPKFGYLPSLLKQLDLNIDSQILVFSKTSFQSPRISPARPRAIYFNDEVMIGSVQNGQVLEGMSFDRTQGMNFYSMDVHQAEKPSFQRHQMTCIQCHMSPGTLNVPGMLISSVFPGVDGSAFLRAGSYVTDHRSPFEERWGGWYVTGTHGSAQHRGNSVARNPQMPSELDTTNSQNLLSLEKKFDVSQYLTGTSDIVALMTIEHQSRMANLIIRVGWEERIASADGTLKDFRKRLAFDVDEMVAYMLFAEEAQFRAPIQGVSTFSKTFPERGPRDKQGRSLRDFDLQKRLFKYPLSYMIYSKAFDSLPPVSKEAVYRKLYDVLTGKDSDKRFERRTPEERKAILEILRDTKPNLPDYWKA